MCYFMTVSLFLSMAFHKQWVLIVSWKDGGGSGKWTGCACKLLWIHFFIINIRWDYTCPGTGREAEIKLFVFDPSNNI